MPESDPEHEADEIEAKLDAFRRVLAHLSLS